MQLKNIRQKMLLSLGVGVAVMLAVSIYGDLPMVAKAIGSFRWEFLVPALVLTLWNYVLRFVKWHYYLSLVGAGKLSKRASFLAFFSGLSMVITPGKIGEWLKCLLVRDLTGTPFSRTAPILIAERLTDGVAMVILAAIGLIVYSYAWQVLVAVMIITVAFVAVIQCRSLSLRILKLGEKIHFLAKRMEFLERFYESSYRLLRLDSLLLAIGIGVVSWMGECAAFFMVLVGLGLDPSPELLLQATFILAASTIIASVAFVPGGLGVAEGSITGMLMVLGVTSEPAIAAAATVLIRFCTLWFGVAVGIGALFLFSREVKEPWDDLTGRDLESLGTTPASEKQVE